jgi:hypothetical protein
MHVLLLLFVSLCILQTCVLLCDRNHKSEYNKMVWDEFACSRKSLRVSSVQNHQSQDPIVLEGKDVNYQNDLSKL